MGAAFIGIEAPARIVKPSSSACIGFKSGEGRGIARRVCAMSDLNTSEKCASDEMRSRETARVSRAVVRSPPPADESLRDLVGETVR